MNQPSLRAQSEPPPGDCTQAYQGEALDELLRSKSFRAISEPPPGDCTQAYQGEALDELLRSKSFRAISEPPPGDCTKAYHGDELDALLRSNAPPRRPEPPSSGHMRVHDRRQLGLLPPASGSESGTQGVSVPRSIGAEGVSVPRSIGAELDDDEDATLAYVRADTAEAAAVDQQLRPAAGVKVRQLVMDKDDATAQAIPNRIVFEGRSPLPTAPELLVGQPQGSLRPSKAAEADPSLPAPYAYGQQQGGTRSVWFWLATGLAALALAAVAFVGLREPTSSQPEVVSKAVVVPPVKPATPTIEAPKPPPVAASPHPMGRLEVDVPAPNAQLSLDGRPVANPLRLALPRDSAEHELRATAPGYTEKTHRFRMDRDIVVLLGLSREKQAGR